MILADRESNQFSYGGIDQALALGEPSKPVDLRLFAKPATLPNRRMGVALARDTDVDRATARAAAAARKVRINYHD